MSLKDPNSMEFDTPCPHWHDPNNPVVHEALDLKLVRYWWSMAIRQITCKVFCPCCLPARCIILIACWVFSRSSKAILLENFSFSLAGNAVSSPDIWAQQPHSHSDRNSTTYCACAQDKHRRRLLLWYQGCSYEFQVWAERMLFPMPLMTTLWRLGALLLLFWTPGS